jgi:L-iditol 2-dehydrogenase
MKAVVLTGIRGMDIIDIPKPKIETDNDVLLKVETVGVCGSDVHYYVTGRIGSQVVEYPYRVGHEFSASVCEIGSAVTSVKIGDKVAVEPAMPCWKCDQCLQGRPHTCRKLKFLGCPGQAPGCLSEYITMPSECCFKIKDTTSFEQAAIVEPLSIGYYAVKQSIDLAGKDIGILGCGPIGLSVMIPALTQKPNKIFITDKIDKRLELAKNHGASWVGNPAKTDIESEIINEAPGLLDVVFECCGEQEALDNALNLLKPGGKLMLIGIPTVDRISFSIDQLRRKEICIQNVRRQNECVQPAIDMIENGTDVDFMVTHHFDFKDSKAAFDLVASYDDGVVKAMINF